MTAPYTPTVSYGSIVERLRRAFGLVGDVPIAPRPDLTNVINVADLTSPGHATYRGRRFMHAFNQLAAAANSYIGIKAADTIVIDSVFMSNAGVVSTYDWRIMPHALADGAGWTWGTQIPFCERILSVNDWAPLLRMNTFVAAPPAVEGILVGTTSHGNNVAAPVEQLRSPIVLQAGDRLMWKNIAVGPTLAIVVGGYVF